MNGLNVTDCRVQDGEIQFRLASPLVVVNGTEAGTWSGAELGKGIPVRSGF